MLTAWLAASALAGGVDPALIERRMGEIGSLRSQRISDDAPTPTAAEYTKAAGGTVVTRLESVPGHKAKKALGIAVVDVSVARLWAAINDESSKVEWTKLGYLEVLEGENCADGRMVLQYLPVTLVTDRWWVVRQSQNRPLQAASEGKVREVRWSSVDPPPVSAGTKAWMDKGIPIAYTHGAWFLVDLDGEHTLIEYYTWTDPGGSIPAGIASSFAAGGISDTFETMTALAKKGPRCPVE